MKPLSPGTVIADRYSVLRVLGEGGMGQVFEVQHRLLGRRFALKVLREDRWNATLVRRFEREAQVLARLGSPRVAQVTDFGHAPGVGPFYVMELLDGETLSQRLDREQRLPAGEAAAIALGMAEALAEVHGANLVHRDLKPSNVGLPFRGPVDVKLLDFGLAAMLDDDAPRLTGSQELLGSIPYMAPEQLSGTEPSPAIDLYALGVVTYETLTGRLPFDGGSAAAIIRRIMAGVVPPMDDPGRGIHVPEPLAAVVMRLMRRDPEQRFADAQEAARALRAAGSTASATISTARAAHTGATPVETETAITLLVAARLPLETHGFDAPADVAVEAGSVCTSATGCAPSSSTPDSYARRLSRGPGRAAIGLVLAGAVALAAVIVFASSDTRPPAPTAARPPATTPPHATPTGAPTAPPPEVRARAGETSATAPLAIPVPRADPGRALGRAARGRDAARPRSAGRLAAPELWTGEIIEDPR